MKKRKTFPKYGGNFAKPVRLSPRGKRQVSITPRIRKFVKNFKGENKLEIARKIVDSITRFKKVYLPEEKAKRLWCRRSADDVIKTKKVYIEKEAKMKAAMKVAGIGGCIDYTEAVTACVRAIGLPVLAVRAENHSFVKILCSNKVYIADPSMGRLRFREMTKMDKWAEDLLRKKGTYAEGASLAEIGLGSIKDFKKYSIQKKSVN